MITPQILTTLNVDDITSFCKKENIKYLIPIGNDANDVCKTIDLPIIKEELLLLYPKHEVLVVMGKSTDKKIVEAYKKLGYYTVGA